MLLSSQNSSKSIATTELMVTAYGNRSLQHLLIVKRTAAEEDDVWDIRAVQLWRLV